MIGKEEIEFYLDWGELIAFKCVNLAKSLFHMDFYCSLIRCY